MNSIKSEKYPALFLLIVSFFIASSLHSADITITGTPIDSSSAWTTPGHECAGSGTIDTCTPYKCFTDSLSFSTTSITSDKCPVVANANLLPSSHWALQTGTEYNDGQCVNYYTSGTTKYYKVYNGYRNLWLQTPTCEYDCIDPYVPFGNECILPCVEPDHNNGAVPVVLDSYTSTLYPTVTIENCEDALNYPLLFDGSNDAPYNSYDCMSCPDVNGNIAFIGGIPNANYIMPDTNTTSVQCTPLAPNKIALIYSQSDCSDQVLFTKYQAGDLDGHIGLVGSLEFDLCTNTCYGIITNCQSGQVVVKGFCNDPENLFKEQCIAPAQMQCYTTSLQLSSGDINGQSCLSRCYCDSVLTGQTYVACNDDTHCIDGYVWDSTLHECITIEQFNLQNEPINEPYETNSTVVTVDDNNVTTTITTTENFDGNNTTVTTTTTKTDENGSIISSTSQTTIQEGQTIDTKDLNQEKTQSKILEELKNNSTDNDDIKKVLESIDKGQMTEQNMTNALVDALSQFFNKKDGSDANATDPTSQNDCPPGELFDIISGECKMSSTTTTYDQDTNTTDSNLSNDLNTTGTDEQGIKDELLKIYDKNFNIFSTDCPAPTWGSALYMGIDVQDPLFIFDQHATEYYSYIRAFFIAFATIGGLMLIFGRD